MRVGPHPSTAVGMGCPELRNEHELRLLPVTYLVDHLVLVVVVGSLGVGVDFEPHRPGTPDYSFLLEPSKRNRTYHPRLLVLAIRAKSSSAACSIQGL